MSKAYLSLGTNMGDRLSNIQQAVRLLTSDNNIKLLKASSFYETQPWGLSEQNWFINAAIAVETELSPIELLRVCQNIEEKLGRIREGKPKWSERIIDIDILFYDDLIFKNEILEIPHKYVHKRAFALVPMIEVNADLKHPILNKTIMEMHEELENPEDVFLYGTVLPEVNR